MTYQFRHKRCNDDCGGKNHQDRTIVCEAMGKKAILEMVEVSVFQTANLLLQFGVAKVHPKDYFEKKVGRETAIKNMKEYKVRVVTFQKFDENKESAVLLEVMDCPDVKYLQFNIRYEKEFARLAEVI